MWSTCKPYRSRTLPHRYQHACRPGAGHTGRAACGFPLHARRPVLPDARRQSLCASACAGSQRPAIDAQLRHFLFQTHQLFNLHRNQRSMLVRLNTPSTDKPARKASAIYQIRSAPASFSSRRILVSASGSSGSLSDRSRSRPLRGRAALQGFLLRAANRHHFTHRFHLGGQTVVRASEFLEVEAWNFGHNVVDRRFEGRRRTAPVMSFISSSRV